MDWTKIPGWCPESEGIFLQKMVALYAHGKTAVEIGSWCGRSAACMMQAGVSKLYCYDPYPETSQATTEAERNGTNITASQALMKMSDLAKQSEGTIVLIIKDGVLGGETWDKENVSLLYVDGEHEAKQVENEINAWLPHMDKDGVIVFDDYEHKVFGGDIKAATAAALIPKGWELKTIYGSKAAWIKA